MRGVATSGATAAWRGIPTLIMELISKYTNQLGIRVFKAKLGALIY